MGRTAGRANEDVYKRQGMTSKQIWEKLGLIDEWKEYLKGRAENNFRCELPIFCLLYTSYLCFYLGVLAQDTIRLHSKRSCYHASYHSHIINSITLLNSILD